MWEVLSDVASWPSWTPTVESVDAGTDGAPLVLGQTVAVKQPKRKLGDYTVWELAEGSSFTWGSARFGVRQRAGHEVEPTGPRSCTVRLSFEFSGWLGSALGVLGAGRIKEMVDTEAQSLKARLEKTSSHSPS